MLLEAHSQVIDAIPCTTVPRTLFDLCGDDQAPVVRRALGHGACPQDRHASGAVDACSTILRNTDVAEPCSSASSSANAETSTWHRRVSSRLASSSSRDDSGCRSRSGRWTSATSESWIGRVDFVFRKARVVVEVDGAAFHDGLLDRRHDEARDARLRGSRMDRASVPVGRRRQPSSQLSLESIRFQRELRAARATRNHAETG